MQQARQRSEPLGVASAKLWRWTFLDGHTMVDAMPNHALRRNTIILSAIPSKAGTPASLSQIVGYVRDVDARYSSREIDDALAQLCGLGYLERVGETFSRLHDSCSLRARKAAA